MTRDLVLLAPRWLWLLAAVPALWAVLWFSLTDLALPQRILGATARSLLVAALALALARPAKQASETRACTVFAVDVSDSVTDAQLAAARDFVQEAIAARGPNDVRVVTFAAGARTVELGEKDQLPPLARHEKAGAATNPSAALRLAYALFPSNRLRRVVVLSDGNETEGDLAAEAERAKRMGVRLHAWPMPDANVRDVAVARLALPDQAKVGAPFEVRADIFSTHETDADLTLLQDEFPNPLEPHKKVHLRAGTTAVTFRSQVKQPGATNYRLSIAHADGGAGRPENDRAVATLEVRGKPRVLYLEGEARSAPYLRQALSRENIDVDVRGPEGVPRSARELEKYDLVLMSDVPAAFVGLDSMAAIETYVRDLGGGFVMAGGENSFGAGGFTGTRIEKLLPVRLDTEKRRDEPQLALVLVIDRSGSMSGEKMELAKEAAKATAEVLGPQDLLGVVAFDSQPTTVVRLQRASNRVRILSDISKIQAGGGTQILPALQEAYSQLGPAHAKVKHVILLTDGQAPDTGIPELVDEMVQNRITITGVGIGSGADRTMLTSIAERGGGRFYFTQDPQSIPKIFVKETSQVARSALVEDLIGVHIAKHVQMIDGVGIEHAPPLRGYVSTKPKPLSEVLLVSDYGEPLLARWRQGLGQAVAFTSDVKNRWASDWLHWPGYQKFWAQLVRSAMRHRAEETFAMTTDVSGGRAHVSLDAVTRGDKFATDLDVSAEIVDPEHPTEKRTITLEETAPGRYEADAPLDRFGSFLVRAVARQKGSTVGESLGSIANPYPREFLLAGIDEPRLSRAAQATGGYLRPEPARVYDAQGDEVRYHRELWSWALIAALALLVIDVALRRIRLFGYRVVGL
jgi:Mg-chelatase subunit ChlD